MKRTRLLGFLLAVLILTLLAGPLQAAETTKPLILKFSSWTPAQVNFGLQGVWIVREMEKRSQGRIKIQYYWSSSLVPTKQIMDAVQKGVADISFVNPNYQPGKMPLLTVTSLPGTGAKDMAYTSKALQGLMEMPEVKAELDALNMHYLGPLTNNSYGAWTNKKQVRKLEDLKGLKLRAIGMHANLLHALGGVPVSLNPTEIYQAIAKGTLDGAFGNPSFALGYKWDEVTKYYYDIPFGGLGQFVVMNKDSWNKLPPDLQKRMNGIHDIACGIAQEIYQGGGDKLLEADAAKGKITVTEPSPEDIAKMMKVSKEKIWDEWVEKMNKRGLPGQKVLDRWLELLAMWHGTSQFK
jgi:TRAP-type C4-dicarboxylate transport system substrate-binding protein